MKFNTCHLRLRFLKCCGLNLICCNSEEMHHEAWSNGALIGVPDLELGLPTDQVTLVTEWVSKF